MKDPIFKSKCPINRQSGIFFLIFIFLLCQSSNALCQDEKLISPKHLLKDLEELEEIIDAHPDPYTHISEADFKSKLDDTKASVNRPYNILEFYKKVASIVAQIKDGHSSVRLPRLWMQNQRKRRGAFPHEVYLTNENELYIIKNFSESEIPVGAKIIGINGISVDSFLPKIDPYISYELEPFRNTIIDGRFEMYLYLAFGHDDIILDYFTSDTTTAAIKYIPYDKWKKFHKDNREEREKRIASGEPYAYKKNSRGIGLLNIYAFSVANETSYNFFLIKTFKKIKKDSIHSLIIDIRGNFGGWPKIASQLFHYISNTYFKTMAQSSMKVSYPYRKKLYEGNPSLRDKSITVIIPERRHFVDINSIINEPLDSYVDESLFFNEEPEVKRFEYDGDCYVLTNRDSYSAASSFASTFQCYQMGYIIGEQTGGTKIFRANAIYEELNKSNLMVSMSTTKLYTTCFDEEFESVKPNINFTPSIPGLSSDMDTHLHYALRTIKRIRKKKLGSQ